MDLDDLRRIGREAKQSAFRLETLPQYLVPGEEADFSAWQTGEPLLPRTSEGHFLYPELIDEIEPYREMRDTALRHSQPLTNYLARKNPTPENLRMIS